MDNSCVTGRVWCFFIGKIDLSKMIKELNEVINSISGKEEMGVVKEVPNSIFV